MRPRRMTPGTTGPLNTLFGLHTHSISFSALCRTKRVWIYPLFLVRFSPIKGSARREKKSWVMERIERIDLFRDLRILSTRGSEHASKHYALLLWCGVRFLAEKESTLTDSSSDFISGFCVARRLFASSVDAVVARPALALGEHPRRLR